MVIINSILKSQVFLLCYLCLSLFLAALPCRADEAIEDLIDILQSKNKIIAVIEGKKSVTRTLRSDETVLWSGSRGELGAFLTNRHFYVISQSSGAWEGWPLRLEESDERIASLSPYIALLATKERALAFDAKTKRFIEARLPIRDQPISAKTSDNVAVVACTSRLLGLAAESSAFSELPLRLGEKVESVKLTANKASIVTSDRLLTFTAEGSRWKEHRLD